MQFTRSALPARIAETSPTGLGKLVDSMAEREAPLVVLNADLGTRKRQWRGSGRHARALIMGPADRRERPHG
jgi:hypothetical protein